MMGSMTEALSYPFVQRALLAGVAIGGLAAYYGVFVVQRGLSFLGNGLAHAAFGGVALGLLLHQEPLWVAIPFTIAVALGIDWLQDRSRLHADTAIGIFFAVSMALGIIFLSKTERFTQDAFAYLFGSILGVSMIDVASAGALIVIAAATFWLWGRWAYATFDRELARSEHLPVRRDERILSICLALTIVVSMKIVGITLISAALVIPPAAARLLTRRFATMTLVSILIGSLSVVAGLWISYVFDIPTGPAVIMVQAGVFVAGMVTRIGRR